jgi:hypothetical protein
MLTVLSVLLILLYPIPSSTLFKTKEPFLINNRKNDTETAYSAEDVDHGLGKFEFIIIVTIFYVGVTVGKEPPLSFYSVEIATVLFNLGLTEGLKMNGVSTFSL